MRVHVQQSIFFALRSEKTWSELFYQFRPQGFLKMADDRTGSVCDVCLETSANQCQSMNDFVVIIDWSSIDRYQSIPIN